MSGDDLAIVLFLESSALALALTAVTIHGWKHKAVLLVLWGFAAVVAALGVNWQWLKAVSPERFATDLSAVASRPMSYVDSRRALRL